MTTKDREACRLVVALLDESQELHQMAKWLLEEEAEEEPVQVTLDI